ncbi:MAG TPA: NAD(P)-dependent oxidoreductase [Pseudomonadales bacterium]|nr:NAD(P)-dependent oxidoreductase [Pseudomonadales bacterium]
MTRLRVLVTGGTGKAGRETVRALVEAGHRVLSVDRQPWPDAPCPSLCADLTDYGQCAGLFGGVDVQPRRFDAVVHLAAIPAPGLFPDEVTFRANMASTYNVLTLALRAGVRRLVWASSETVLGLPFRQAAPGPPAYAPVDDDHGDRPAWSYALAKTLGEEMARQFARWYPDATLIGLRFSNVMTAADYAAFGDWQADALLRSWNLWGYVDVEDAAQACLKALTAPVSGARNYIIAAADTVMRRPSAELMAEVFPDVKLSRPLVGRETLLSSARAGAELAYAPARSWIDSV